MVNEKQIQKLIKLATKAKENAYSPYSKFKVGACVLTTKGKTYVGCNVENASFGATNCAERTAIFSAIANGEKTFEAIAIVGSNNNSYAFPCGICRQVLSEFGDLLVIIAKTENDYKTYKLSELLPNSFKKDSF